MKTKHVVLVLVAIVIFGLAALTILNLHPGTAGQSGASGIQTKANELATIAKLAFRDLLSRHQEMPRSTKQILEWVPFGSPMEDAQRTMKEHKFVCSVEVYTEPAQMSNSAIWYAPFVKNGQRVPVTNVARLTCTTNHYTAMFWLINGETTSLAEQGKF